MTTQQNKAIWASANRLGIDSDMLHDIVYSMFNVDSLKKLDTIQALYLYRRLNSESSNFGTSYASDKQIYKIKILFDELGFSEAKRREWLFRSKSLKAEMNVSELASDKLSMRIQQKEATSLIAALIKTKKYLESKQK